MAKGNQFIMSVIWIVLLCCIIWPLAACAGILWLFLQVSGLCPLLKISTIHYSNHTAKSSLYSPLKHASMSSVRSTDFSRRSSLGLASVDMQLHLEQSHAHNHKLVPPSAGLSFTMRGWDQRQDSIKLQSNRESRACCKCFRFWRPAPDLDSSILVVIVIVVLYTPKSNHQDIISSPESLVRHPVFRLMQGRCFGSESRQSGNGVPTVRLCCAAIFLMYLMTSAYSFGSSGFDSAGSVMTPSSSGGLCCGSISSLWCALFVHIHAFKRLYFTCSDNDIAVVVGEGHLQTHHTRRESS